MSKTYIVHVIDEATQHQQGDGEYAIVKGQSDEGEVCDVLRSDAFYIVDARDYEDAMIIVANMIRVRGSDNALHPIAEEFSKSRSEIENASFEEGSILILKKDDLDYIDQTISYHAMASCQIPREIPSKGEEWIERHLVHFYVTPQEKTILIKNEE